MVIPHHISDGKFLSIPDGGHKAVWRHLVVVLVDGGVAGVGRSQVKVVVERRLVHREAVKHLVRTVGLRVTRVRRSDVGLQEGTVTVIN